MNKISGIYQIQSKIKPERIYIGSTADINHRWNDHLSLLRNNKHHSCKLQNHFNKYGEPDLQFSILLRCNKDKLINVEQFYIDTYKPWFNVCPKAGTSLGIKQTKEWIEKAARGHYVPIFQYNLQGIFIREWESATIAGKILNINRGHIRNVCNERGLGKNRSAGNYIWRYKKDNLLKVESYTNYSTTHQYKTIYQYDLQGKFIKEWKSIIFASKKLLIDRSTINRCALHQRSIKTAGGYVWKYKI
jgi:group I intron endonuclease